MKPLFSPIFHSVRPRMKNHALFLMAWFALSASAVHAAGPAGAVLPDPLDLKSAIVYALDHNYAILQSRELIRQQEGIVVQVKAPGIPNVAATGSYQRNQSTVSETFPLSNAQWLAQVKATQVLFAGEASMPPSAVPSSFGMLLCSTSRLRSTRRF